MLRARVLEFGWGETPLGVPGPLPGDSYRTALVEHSFAHLSERTLANLLEHLDRTSGNFPWKLQGVRNAKHATLHTIRRPSAAILTMEGGEGISIFVSDAKVDWG